MLVAQLLQKVSASTSALINKEVIMHQLILCSLFTESGILKGLVLVEDLK